MLEIWIHCRCILDIHSSRMIVDRRILTLTHIFIVDAYAEFFYYISSSTIAPTVSFRQVLKNRLPNMIHINVLM